MNNIKYVGWSSQQNTVIYNQLFSKQTYNEIQLKCAEILKRTFPNDTILASEKTIKNVLDSVFSSHSPLIGDIYSGTQLQLERNRNDVKVIIDRTINIIITQITNEYMTERNNKKLSIWTTQLGEFNDHGLRGHSTIKLNNRRPRGMQFNMTY